MDKYEYRLKAEHIVKLVGRKKYKEAMEEADEIDWNRVKNVQMLSTVSDVYARNGKFEEAREILYLANDRSPADRMIVYQIVELSIELGDLREAVNYFKEYSQLAPNDNSIYILKYKLYVANNAPIDTLISVLEEFKEQDFHEEWGVELARLYAQAGYADKCVDLCDEVDLWFNDGPYVIQALELKQRFEILTEAQQEKLDQSYAMRVQADAVERMMAYDEPVEQAAENDEEMFYAANENNNSELLEENQYDMNVGFDENVSRLDELDESLESLEYYPDDDANFDDEDDIDDDAVEDGDSDEKKSSKEKKHSGGMFSRFGRLSRMLVEPISEYDDEEDDEEEDYENEIQEDEKISDENPNADVEEENYEVEESGVEETQNTEKFNLGALAAAQEKYEETRVKTESETEYEEKVVPVEEKTQELPHLAEKAELEKDINIETNTETETNKNTQVLESSENKENEESQDDKLGDTKRFDRDSFREKYDNSVYEKNIQNALRNLGLTSDSEETSKEPELEETEEVWEEQNGDSEEITDGATIEDIKNDLDKEEVVEEVSEEKVSEEKPALWNGVSQYDTMNLQKELAKSIQKLLDATEMDDVDSTLEDVKKLVEDSNIPELTETMRFRTIRATMLSDWAKNQAEKLNNTPQIEESVEKNYEIYKAEGHVEPARKFRSIPKRAEVEVIPSIKLKPTKEDRKRKLEQILVQEDDGQIGLIMPEQEVVEKQITGQLNIEDILKEWERQKNNEETEKEKKKLEEARQKALNETQEFMSQVMDLLNQCLPKCAEDGCSFKLSEKLKTIQQALNSTNDLSEISKLNSELADTLEKICAEKEEMAQEEDYGIFQEEIAATEELEENMDSESEEVEEVLEENADSESEEVEEVLEENADSESEEDEEVLEENADSESEEVLEENADSESQEDEETFSNENSIFDEEESEIPEEWIVIEENDGVEDNVDSEDVVEESLVIPEVEEAADKYNTEDLTKIMEEALQSISEQMQSTVSYEDENSFEKAEEDLQNFAEEMKNQNLYSDEEPEEIEEVEELQAEDFVEEPEEAEELRAEDFGEEPEETEELRANDFVEEPEETEKIEKVEELQANDFVEEPEETEDIQEVEETKEDEESMEADLVQAVSFEEELSQEDDDAADDLEDRIEADLPESVRAITDSEKTLDLFEPAEVELTDNQKEIFSYFNSVEAVKNQVNKLLNVDKKGNENMIITGADGCGKTSLAIRIMKAQYSDDESKKDKIAKIKGSTLNSYDLAEVFEKVNGGVLIIEKAVALSDTTIKALNDKLDEGANVQIILTMKNKSIERMESRNPEFMSRFTVFLEVPTYLNDELVEYGKVYADANGYVMEDMAVLALFSCLGNLQSVRGSLDLNDVKDIIDGAIENAKKRNGKLFKRMFGKRSEHSSKTLLEEDFEKIN